MNLRLTEFAREQMPRGGARVGAGRPPKDGGLGQDQVPVEGESVSGLVRKDPLTYMLDLMNDPDIDDSRRDRLAVAAAPYVHPKIGEGGKKDQRKLSASLAEKGKFATAAPPKLVVNNH